ncbi:hypothetical protein ACXYW7_02670 [Mesomycoplasma ovipneumoniae]|uniref:hypothetical protein n=1 Tax=Mesomycoplasma ovipneumoniae TaxID=29562 RepID=UPI0028AB0018|nr:hypothetical protein [Mesomycoplasma ovipneumoniae]MDW2933525.1 hypothetical protein [Mesomycoplasma ovipneumoniae]WNM16015.1 hypothetical protein RNM12_01240 [Mesomycoplasma ovipneumoniae]
MDSVNHWVDKIQENLLRYQNVVELYRSISIWCNQIEKVFTINLNLLDFPHGIGLKKIPFLKGWPTRKIIHLIETGKLSKKFTNFQKWNIRTNRSLLSQIKAKLLVWDYYLSFLEGNYYKTWIIEEVSYTKNLFLFRGLLWKNEKFTMIVGLIKYKGNKKFANDHCSFFTALLTSKEISDIAKKIDKISKIDRIWYNYQNKDIDQYSKLS